MAQVHIQLISGRLYIKLNHGVMGNSTVFGTVDICSIQIGSVKSTHKGSIAQLVEQLTFNQPVIGSIPIALIQISI